MNIFHECTAFFCKKHLFISIINCNLVRQKIGTYIAYIHKKNC